MKNKVICLLLNLLRFHVLLFFFEVEILIITQTSLTDNGFLGFFLFFFVGSNAFCFLPSGGGSIFIGVFVCYFSK